MLNVEELLRKGEVCVGYNKFCDAFDDCLGIKSDAKDGLKDGLNLSVNQKKLLVLIKSNPLINLDELARILKISKRNVEKNVSTLKSKGLIQREGSKKSGKWVVKE
jgi:predicted HTH transcriptional regulator